MKAIWIMLVLIFTAGQIFGQKKAKIDPRDATIDSLTAMAQGLEIEMGELRYVLEEAQRDLTHYAAAREMLKNKVVKYDFPPAAMPMILDTMLINRANTVQALEAKVKSLEDDVLILQADNNRFQEALESMKEANANPDKIASELRQLKSLLDMEILTQEEFDGKKAKLLAKWE